MTTTEVSASELKTLDPKAFEREYYEWLRYGLYADWAEPLVEMFTERAQEAGIHVDGVRWHEDYGWFAAVEGSIYMHVLMEMTGLHEKYLPLYLHAKDTGERITLRRVSQRGGVQQARMLESGYKSNPQGMFSELDEDTWNELVNDMYGAEDWEQVALDYVKPYTDELEEWLEDEYDYLTSEEAFIERCEANEITFEIEVEETAHV